MPRLLALSIVALAGCTRPAFEPLDAGAGDPVYATYAAHRDRSSFLLDEGYAWLFYRPDRGLDFTTDTAGDLGLYLRVDGQERYLLRDLAGGAIIAETYPDLVAYSYWSTEAVRVDATFLVRTSREAVWDLALRNTSSEPVRLDLAPFVRNGARSFDTAELIEGGLFFTHREYADSWTRDHDMPHEEAVRDLLLVSSAGAVPGAYTRWDDEPASFPFVVAGGTPQFRLQGRTFIEGERNIDPALRIQVRRHDETDRLITEHSAVPGAYVPAVEADGAWRMELGWLGDVRPGDTYDVQFFSEAGRLGRRVGYAVPPGRTDARMDGHLEAYDGPPIPTQVRMEAGLLSWASEGAVNIYRRRYPESVYTLQATVTDARTWSDAAMEPGALYGYVLTGLDAMGEPGMHSVEATSLPASRFVDHVARGEAGVSNAMVRVVAYQESVTLEPGATHTLRVVRLVQPEREDPARLLEAGRQALAEPLDAYLAADRAWQAGLRLDRFRDRDERLLFLSAANMMTQVFYPPEGEASYPYYVFSREPTWGWGHGGQVFHESLTMLAYAQIDPKGAMDSQRLYAERQHPNGYINYRTGAYLNEVILHNDTLTSSAPWYAWQNYEVYRETGDRAFLETMYASSARFYRFYVSNRDADGDGLAEWGGHAVLESVRDAAVAVWDEVGWPAQFDGVDVNSMLVMEAKSLEAMALELGLAEEAAEWRADHERRAALINRFMWDPETAFYYNIDRRDNDFSYSTENDLKRKEIIGFLPLWAGIADSSQAAALVRHLTDTTSFWRPYGIPSLAADDPYYHPKGYWNGPVWVEWNYLIYHGLRAYGYDREADALTQKNAEALIAGLRSTHNLWEFYSPDEAWAGYHRTYIWAGIINRMLADRAVR